MAVIQRAAKGIGIRRLAAALAFAALGGLFAGVAMAQVQAVQGGRALDANPMQGGGGYNAYRPITSGINSANLIVTGNVTQGQAFQGFSPIRSASEMFIGVPSGGLSNFVRDSVGLPAIGAGALPGVARPYYDPSRTVASPGLAAESPYRIVQPAYRAGLPASVPPISPLTANRMIVPDAASPWQPTGVGMFRPDIVTGLPGDVLAAPQVRPRRDEGIALSAQPLREAPQADVTERPESPSRSALPPESPLARLIEPFAPAPAVQPRPEPLGPQDLGSQLAGADQLDSTLLEAMRRTVSPTPAQPDLGVVAAARRPGDDLRLLQPGLQEPQRQRLRSDIRREQAAELLASRLRMPIRTFSGSNATQVDRLFGQAEDLLKAGKFYEAARAYGALITLVPDNALAWLGRSNALLAAGEYVSAYQAIEQALARFEQLLTFPLDLPALVGGGEILDIRRAEIEKILATRSDHRLEFLLGYTEYFSGLRETGLEILGRAAAAAPADSVVREAYRALAAQQPAGQPGP